MGFEFLMSYEEYPDKLNGYSTLRLECCKETQWYDRMVSRKRNKG